MLLGIPSSIAFAFLGFNAARLHLTEPRMSDSSATGDQLIDGFVASVRFMGKLISFFNGAAKWAITALAVVAFLCVGFALLLFFTARGLNAGKVWARGLGILLVILPLLVSFITLTTLRRPAPFLISSLTFAASLYVIWALSWRYS